MNPSPTTQEARTMPATLFSVTLDVRHNGDSHGTITEVVEADTAAAAETQLVDQASEMLPSNRSFHPLVTVQLTVDREHRFEEGDLIAHADAPGVALVVMHQSWRVVGTTAYPTYTLLSRDEFDAPGIVQANADNDDILDTNDLVSYDAQLAQEGR